jgi:hypothetical protein
MTREFLIKLNAYLGLFMGDYLVVFPSSCIIVEIKIWISEVGTYDRSNSVLAKAEGMMVRGLILNTLC